MHVSDGDHHEVTDIILNGIWRSIFIKSDFQINACSHMEYYYRIPSHVLLEENQTMSAIIVETL